MRPLLKAFSLVALLIFGVSQLAGAGCVGKSVNAFGARGDGHTDDTAAIQTALNAAAAKGGGSVVLEVARYFTAGTLFVPNGVVLCGATEGPFDVTGINPATTTIASTLLITSKNGPFINLGLGAGVTDILFHYPHQVHSNATSPIPYPFTIQIFNPGTKVMRCTVTNAYSFLDIEVGRVMAESLLIGAYKYGVYVDHSQDFVTLRNVTNSVFWDIYEGVLYPTTIDAWVLQNGYAAVVNRADSIHFNEFLVFSRFAGFWLRDSPDPLQNPTYGYGSGNIVDLDTVQYGIILSASNSPAYKFTNIDIGAAPGLGKAAAYLAPGGSTPPTLEINGGSQRGIWADGPFPAPVSGFLIVRNVIAYDVP
jgi:hypothetical protein